MPTFWAKTLNDIKTNTNNLFMIDQLFLDHYYCLFLFSSFVWQQMCQTDHFFKELIRIDVSLIIILHYENAYFTLPKNAMPVMDCTPQAPTKKRRVLPSIETPFPKLS